MRLPRKHQVITWLALGLPQACYAGGSVSLTQDVLPLLKEKPALVQSLLGELVITDVGDATRIGSNACPGLAGVRVSPYLFRAKEREDDGSDVQLIINSDVDFLAPDGKIVFHIEDGVPGNSDRDFSSAVSLRETFSSLVLKVARTKSAVPPLGFLGGRR